MVILLELKQDLDGMVIFDEKKFGNLELKFKRNIYGWKEKYKVEKLNLENNQNLSSIKTTISRNFTS